MVHTFFYNRDCSCTKASTALENLAMPDMFNSLLGSKFLNRAGLCRFYKSTTNHTMIMVLKFFIGKFYKTHWQREAFKSDQGLAHLADQVIHFLEASSKNRGIDRFSTSKHHKLLVTFRFVLL